MKLLYVPMLMLLIVNSLTSGSPPTADAPRMTTTGPSVANLKGKMFTLAEGISLSPPNFNPPSTSWPSPKGTHSYTARPYTASPETQTKGVSVCLRFIRVNSYSTPTLFTLSPNTSPLALRLDRLPQFVLSCDKWGRTNIGLQPDIKLWSKIQPEIWTRVCVTVDTERSVAQVFSGSNMSVRSFFSAWVSM